MTRRRAVANASERFLIATRELSGRDGVANGRSLEREEKYAVSTSGVIGEYRVGDVEEEALHMFG